MTYDGSIDWGSSYSCSWRLVEVDTRTWADAAEVTGATNASVSRDRGGDLIDGGSLTVEMGIDDIPYEFVGRIELLAEQQLMERHPIATLRFVPGESSIHEGRRIVSYDGYGVLRPASTLTMLAGEYVPKGTDAAQWVVSKLKSCMKAPVEAKGSFSLAEAYVFDGGTTYLTDIWELLDNVGWCLRVDERGQVVVMELPSDPALVLDSAHASMLQPELSSNDGLASTANRYIAVDGDSMAIAVDESDRISSYAVRGYYVDQYDSSPTRLDGETLQAYAQRKLDEETSVAGTRTYTRAYWPDALPFDIVRGSLASVGLDCDMRILSQSIQIGAGVKVTETAEVIAR